MEDWKDHYSVLTQADRDHPIESLDEICSRDFLFSHRRELFDLFEAALQSEVWEGDTPETKSERFFFCQTTLYLWEIAFRIIQQINEKKLLYSYTESQTKGAS